MAALDRRRRRLATIAAPAAIALLAASALAAEHLGHYAARAHANQRSLLAEMLAQPICNGSDSPGARVAELK